jgi:hypothetical protein
MQGQWGVVTGPGPLRDVVYIVCMSSRRQHPTSVRNGVILSRTCCQSTPKDDAVVLIDTSLTPCGLRLRDLSVGPAAMDPTY